MRPDDILSGVKKMLTEMFERHQHTTDQIILITKGVGKIVTL